MTDRGQQLQRAIAMNLQLLAEHEKTQPDEVDAIVLALVAHIRSWRPRALIGGMP